MPQITTAQSQHASKISQLFWAITQEQDYLRSNTPNKTEVARRITIEGAHFEVITTDTDKVLGFLHAIPADKSDISRRFSSSPNCMWISWLMVAKECRGTGMAQELMDRFIKACNPDVTPSAEAMVATENDRSLRFFKRNQFTTNYRFGSTTVLHQTHQMRVL